MRIAGTRTPTKAVAKKAAPAFKKAAARRPESRRRDDDDYDDDDDDRRGGRTNKDRKKGSALSGDAIQVGWAGADTMAARGSGFTNNMSIESGDFAVLKFLDDSPYASQRVHWLNRDGRRSFICAQPPLCPLCAGGSDHRLEVRFSVALLTEDTPVLKSFNCGKSLRDQLKDANEARSGPLSRHYYLYTKKGAGLKTRHKVEMLRRTDIEADYKELYIPEVSELEELGTYTRDDVINETTMEELEEVADEYFSGGYRKGDDDVD